MRADLFKIADKCGATMQQLNRALECPKSAPFGSAFVCKRPDGLILIRRIVS